jgi:hypothetical protein
VVDRTLVGSMVLADPLVVAIVCDLRVLPLLCC